MNKIDFTPEQIQLIKSQIAPKATNDELALFLYQCKRTGLDPLTRQIYCMHRKSKGVEKMTIQTSIDGFRVIAERSGDYAGQSKPKFTYDNNGHLVSAEVTVFRFKGETRYECATAEAFWEEYVVTNDEWVNGQKTGNKVPSEMWNKMKRTMLAKVAEALALRKAYPQDLSGLYTTEEMAQATDENAAAQQAPPAQLPEGTSIPFTPAYNQAPQSVPVQVQNQQVAPAQQAPPALTPFNKAYTDSAAIVAVIKSAAKIEDLNSIYHFNKELIERMPDIKTAITHQREVINNQGKMILNEVQYQKICNRIRKGENVIEEAKKNFILNAGQIEELQHLTNHRALLDEALKLKYSNTADIAGLIRECTTISDLTKLHSNNAMIIDREPELTTQMNGKSRTLKTAA